MLCVFFSCALHSGGVLRGSSLSNPYPTRRLSLEGVVVCMWFSAQMTASWTNLAAGIQGRMSPA